MTSSEAEVKLIQLKVDQMSRENDEIRAQKRELDAALRKLQAENAQAVSQVFICSKNGGNAVILNATSPL